MVFVDKKQVHTGDGNTIYEGDEKLIEYLLDNEGACKRLFEEEAAVVLLVDPGTLDILDANDTAKKLYGWNAELHQKNLRDITVLPTGSEKDHIDAGLSAGIRHSISRHRVANGAIIDLKIYKSPVLGEQEIQYYVIIDITKRKELDERRYITDFSLHNYSDAVFCTGSNGQFFYVNNAACTHLGYSEEELLTMGVSDVNANFKWDKWERHWERIKNEKEFIFQTVHRSRCGKNIPVEISVNYMIYDGKEYNCAVVKDMTERKRTEKGLKLACFSLENFSDAVIWAKENGSIFYVNKAVCDLLDYSSDELLSLSIPDINPMFTTESWKEHWKDVQTNKDFFLETTIYSSSGKPIPVEITANYMNYEGKEYNYAIIKDITERKKAEKKLQMACFSVENFVDPVAWIKDDGKFIYVNQAACDLLGYTKKEFLSMSVFDISSYYTPDIWERRWNKIKDNKKGHIEGYFNTRSGEEVPVSISSTYMNYEGKEYICAFAVDITDRKKIEKDLYLAFFSLENGYDPALWVRSKGQILYTNKAACDLLGYTEEELLSLSILNITSDFTPSSWDEHWKNMREKKTDFKEGTVRTREGKVLPIEITASYLNYEGEEYHCAFFRDISERKKNEKALAEEVNWRRRLMDGSRDGIVVLGMNGKVFEANTAYARMLGYTQNEIRDLHIWDWDKNFSKEELLGLLNTNAFKRGLFEVEHYRKNGTTINVEISAGHIEFADQKLSICVCRDITQRRRSEEVLRLASFSLENSSDAVFWLEKNGKVFYVNNAACKLLKYSREELLTMSVKDINPIFSYLSWEEHWTKLKKNRTFHVETDFLTKYGDICPVEVTSGYLNYQGKEYDCAFVRDLSESKKNEKALLESKAQLRTLVDTIPDLVWLKDTDGIYLACNTRFKHLYGAREEEIVGNTDYDFVEKETADIFRKMDRKAIDTGDHIVFEEEVTYADGHKECLETIKSPVYDDNGKLIGVLGVGRDITQRKRSEEQLKKASFSLENSSDAVIWADKAGNIDYVNKAACDLIGYSGDEFLSMKVFDASPMITPEDWEEHWDRIKEEKVINAETFIPDKSKRMLPVEVTVSYMNYEGKEYDCAIIRDLTERKKYERKLEQEVRGRRNLMDRSKDGIVSLDMDGKVFEANPAYARMLGYTMEEMKDLHVWDWDVNYNEEQLLNIIRNNDETGLFLETKQRRKDGRVLDIDLNSNAVEFADQKLVFCVCRDVTERKREINELLEAKLIAETASKVKDEFLATMSHELRTPLNSILGFSDILQSCSFGEINDMQAEYLSYISKSGEHLLNVINNILDLSKIEAGKMKLNYETFFMSEILDEIIMTLEPIADKKNIELTITSEITTGTIEADRTKFKEIFYNLASNAIKFTPEKGKVDIDLRKGNEMLSIKVKDTGIGIATEDMDQLFHPFKQLNPYMNHEYEGTGLGLAITKKYIEMHGGNISVKSKVGEGTTFIFSIPLKLNV